MPLTLAQTFPLGRFHATRWNQNPFEDPYGEWPPSPWRFLRALAARWFQYSRETGDGNAELRDGLLSKLAREVPSFNLPEATWRGVAIPQYQPTGVAWSDAQKKNSAYKRPGSTMVHDHYRAVAPRDPIYWVWDAAELEPQERKLLSQLLQRLLYFGRAESYCRFRVFDGGSVAPNCRLERTAGAGQPVLVAIPGGELNLESLLAVTDSDLLKQRRIPPGTAWYYATIPPRQAVTPTPAPRRRYAPDIRVLQFAVGGRVYPPLAHWVKLTERFREEVIRERCRQITSGRTTQYGKLTEPERDALSLIRGLDGQGNRIQGHATTFFAIIPDQKGLPNRLVCWRDTPFTDDEIDALLVATERPLAWDRSSADWQVRLVAIPFSVPRPTDYWTSSRVWQSVTPFVQPTGRRRFRKNGRRRTGETPQACLGKLLVKCGLPQPSVELVSGEEETVTQKQLEWVTIHESSSERRHRLEERSTRMLPGYRFRIVFPEPVQGPFAIGHSCHFGLGLFRQEQ